MSTNGVAVYLRNIRTILNQAIADDLTENYPFKKFKIRTEVTRNRNLSSEEIRMIRDYAAPDRRQEISRDFFMLQFLLLGINTFDIFWITSSGMVGDRLQFNRGKTGKFCNIKIEPEAQVLIGGRNHCGCDLRQDGALFSPDRINRGINEKKQDEKNAD